MLRKHGGKFIHTNTRTRTLTHKLLIKKDGHADVDEYNVGCITSLCQQNKRDFAEERTFFNFLPIIIKMTKKHATAELVCSMFVHCCQLYMHSDGFKTLCKHISICVCIYMLYIMRRREWMVVFKYKCFHVYSYLCCPVVLNCKHGPRCREITHHHLCVDVL